ncbi:LPXTG cell wall anchor domain-containing protein, partial [Gemella morbillorum]|uniref:LPXTG cell wall anchor domain-containing protein n=1 Tax=Gemella morbillorum TaxID=29391 RepID=UPI001CB1D881
DKIAIEIGKVNSDLPEGTSVTIGNDGEVTFTYSDGSTNKIPGKYTVGLKGQTQPTRLEEPKAKEETKRLPNTGVVTNNGVVAGLSILALATLLAARRKNNK